VVAGAFGDGGKVGLEAVQELCYLRGALGGAWFAWAWRARFMRAEFMRAGSGRDGFWGGVNTSFSRSSIKAKRYFSRSFSIDENYDMPLKTAFVRCSTKCPKAPMCSAVLSSPAPSRLVPDPGAMGPVDARLEGHGGCGACSRRP
jgi:hypothetical protein